MAHGEQKFERFITYLQLESERIIIDYQTIIASEDGKKGENDDSDDGDLYKNEFRVQKMKKLRVEEFPQVLDLKFKIDEDDNFTVPIDIAFMIQKRSFLFNVLRKLILPK